MVYLIDASIYVFRAYFSVPDTVTDNQGNMVNALFGFGRFLGDLLESVRPELIAVAFDESLTKSFRNDIYPPYKANREPPPPELTRQFGLCRELVRGLGVMEAASGAFEADDLIGTMAVRMRGIGHNSVIVTRDKDLAQILREGDEYWDFANNKRLSYDEIPEFFGVQPEQIADLLALAGDSVDNIPGVPGIGKKTAMALLRYFESLDDIYANLDRVKEVPVRGAAKLADRLHAYRDDAYLAKRLTVIDCDAPLVCDESAMRRRRPDEAALHALYDSAGFGRPLRNQAERIALAYSG